MPLSIRICWELYKLYSIPVRRSNFKCIKACDLNFQISVISSETAILGYKAYTNKKSTILLSLILPNMYADEEVAQLLVERTIDYIYYGLLMHLGKNDLYNNTTPMDIDKLKKLIEVYNFDNKI